MAKVKLYKSTNGSNEQLWFYCPGCKCDHAFTTKDPTFAPWTFNGDFNKPTFSPSLMCNRDNPESRCHSYVRDGKIEFLGDCFHDLKNTTVELPEYE